MGKIGKLIKRFFRGKKEEEKSSPSHDSIVYGEKNPKTLLNSVLEIILKEKRRWSFGRSSADSKEVAATVQLSQMQAILDSENDQKKHAIVMLLTPGTNGRSVNAIEEAAAIKIQSVFRAHLARKALRALKGLVKLQALVKGYLVRKQATAMLRCMQALVAAQAKACEQRIRLREEQKRRSQSQSVCVKLTNEEGFIHTNYETVRDTKEKIKIVEIEEETVKSSHCQLCHLHQLRTGRINDKLSSSVQYSELDPCQLSPAMTELSFRTYCNRFENYSISPQDYYAALKPHLSWSPLVFPHVDYAYSTAYDLPLYPSYMGYTESSRAKVRAQSAPKERLHSFERPPSWRKASPERRNVPRRPSHVSRRSSSSTKDSECGSSTTVI